MNTFSERLEIEARLQDMEQMLSDIDIVRVKRIAVKPQLVSFHDDYWIAWDNLETMGLSDDTVWILMGHYGIAQMVLDNPYMPPLHEEIIKYGEFQRGRWVHDENQASYETAAIFSKEYFYQGDYWQVWYSPALGEWKTEFTPF